MTEKPLSLPLHSFGSRSALDCRFGRLGVVAGMGLAAMLCLVPGCGSDDGQSADAGSDASTDAGDSAVLPDAVDEPSCGASAPCGGNVTCGGGFICIAGCCQAESDAGSDLDDDADVTGPCGDLTFDGECDGTTVRWCQNNAVQTLECADFYPAGTGSCEHISEEYGYFCALQPGDACLFDGEDGLATALCAGEDPGCAWSAAASACTPDLGTCTDEDVDTCMRNGLVAVCNQGQPGLWACDAIGGGDCAETDDGARCIDLAEGSACAADLLSCGAGLGCYGESEETFGLCLPSEVTLSIAGTGFGSHAGDAVHVLVTQDAGEIAGMAETTVAEGGTFSLEVRVSRGSDITLDFFIDTADDGGRCQAATDLTWRVDVGVVDDDDSVTVPAGGITPVDLCDGFVDADGDGVPNRFDVCWGVDGVPDVNGDGLCRPEELCTGEGWCVFGQVRFEALECEVCDEDTCEACPEPPPALAGRTVAFAAELDVASVTDGFCLLGLPGGPQCSSAVNLASPPAWTFVASDPDAVALLEANTGGLPTTGSYVQRGTGIASFGLTARLSSESAASHLRLLADLPPELAQGAFTPTEVVAFEAAATNLEVYEERRVLETPETWTLATWQASGTSSLDEAPLDELAGEPITIRLANDDPGDPDPVGDVLFYGPNRALLGERASGETGAATWETFVSGGAVTVLTHRPELGTGERYRARTLLGLTTGSEYEFRLPREATRHLNRTELKGAVHIDLTLPEDLILSTGRFSVVSPCYYSITTAEYNRFEMDDGPLAVRIGTQCAGPVYPILVWAQFDDRTILGNGEVLSPTLLADGVEPTAGQVAHPTWTVPQPELDVDFQTATEDWTLDEYVNYVMFNDGQPVWVLQRIWPDGDATQLDVPGGDGLQLSLPNSVNRPSAALFDLSPTVTIGNPPEMVQVIVGTQGGDVGQDAVLDNLAMATSTAWDWDDTGRGFEVSVQGDDSLAGWVAYATMAYESAGEQAVEWTVVTALDEDGRIVFPPLPESATAFVPAGGAASLAIDLYRGDFINSEVLARVLWRGLAGRRVWELIFERGVSPWVLYRQTR